MLNKEMLNDFKEFSWLQKILALIDLLLNPRAVTYPFITVKTGDAWRSEFKRHLIIKEMTKGDETELWCLRWL
jgi:hypothetical protein